MITGTDSISRTAPDKDAASISSTIANINIIMKNIENLTVRFFMNKNWKSLFKSLSDWH